MLVYFDYYNRARSARIGAVAGELATACGARAGNGVASKPELAALEEAQAREVAALERSRDERRAPSPSSTPRFATALRPSRKLRAEEQRLAELVKRVSELMAGFPVDTDEPFARLKGKLAWPVQGRLAGDYGQPRGAGPVKWNGVLLEASRRHARCARSITAAWRSPIGCKGLGLLVIVDHGGGYMSLYGHNEALLKESGDWVEPGEADRASRRHGRAVAAGAVFRDSL